MYMHNYKQYLLLLIVFSMIKLCTIYIECFKLVINGKCSLINNLLKARVNLKFH